ncbi:MAG: hypothetical protein QM809_08655 [Gordonia sp. (in: high G+C Gram-positive bacteria)]|uniref:hypothetical protein n=1 Tax=Gordonia sp. (in: high G+C Gram-positive bacteria) TaxID=84139 RepID=UPI0039E6BC39
MLAATAAVLVLNGCAEPADPPAVPPPVLGFLVGRAGECSGPGGITAERIRAQADGLVRTGLREAGYATLFVPCDDEAPATDDAALRRRLSALGVTVERVPTGDRRVASTMPADAAEPVLCAQITRRVMRAESLVFAGDPARIPAPNLALIGNRAVIEAAVDARRAPGAPVGGDPEVSSRAVGSAGLLVSLHRAGEASSSDVSVAIAELNLSGDDAVPATELWTGRRIRSVGGRLTVDLEPGGTALLSIG